jgi:hypothetical protein
MSEPLVSVLLSSHNGERYLAQALDSMAAQTYGNWEWVLVDNASTDGTAGIMESYRLHRSDRVRVLRNKDKLDLAESLNRGLEAIRGSLIARMDDDDISHPDRLSRLVAAMETDSGLVMAGTVAERLDEATGLTDLFMRPCDPIRASIALCWYNPFIHSSVMFRRSKPDGSPVRYPTRFSHAEDYALWAELSCVGRVEMLPHITLTYRKRAGGMTGSRRDLQLSSTREVSAWYTRTFTDETALAGVTPDQIRSWIEDPGVPNRERINNVRRLFQRAARPAFMRSGEGPRALMDWAAPCLDAGTLSQLMVGDSRRLLLCAGLREAFRYAARRRRWSERREDRRPNAEDQRLKTEETGP